MTAIDPRYRGLRPRQNASIQERLDFYSIPEPNSGCILWFGSVRGGGNGYGGIKFGGKSYLSHRVAWTLVNGPIPGGLFVCHKCDVSACINPDHLFLGTTTDNMQDKCRKGRQNLQPLRGEDVPHAKLTEEQVRSIRNDTRTQRQIANEYGLDQSAISNIKTRRNWRHVL